MEVKQVEWNGHQEKGENVMSKFAKSSQGVKMTIRIDKTFSSMSIKCSCQKNVLQNDHN
jgi:hypothetical protein